MKKLLLYFAVVFAMLAGIYTPVNAGGPLVVKGGMSITYGTRPFLYRFDQGKLGMFSNSEAIAIIEDLFDDWQAIKTSEIKFQRDNPGELNLDVTADNFNSILNSPDLLGYTPIIFDEDGSLLEAFLGDGAGDSVLGISGPITISSGPLVNQIAESQAIFNGRFVNGIDSFSDPESSTTTFKGTIIHEVGHGIGLDHSQINVEAIKAGTTQEIRDSVPLEFPVAVNDLFEIRRDDASSVSLLYPNASQLVNFGTIEGKVFRANGTTPVQGANVIARNINNPKLEAISCVSDYLIENNGKYTLFAVPPGDYRIEIEPIDLSFTGGSGIGPFTETKSSKSFQNPVPKGFYTGPNLPITENENEALIIMVQAGQTLSNQNIIASATATTTSSTSSSSSSSTTGGGIINEIEPNDEVAFAQEVQIPIEIMGNASSADDGEIELQSDSGSSIIISDLFRFTLTNNASISALLTIESDLSENDLDLVLLDEFAVDILDASSQTGNADELVTQVLTPGTYLIGVGAFSGAAAYTLNITLIDDTGVPSVNLSGPTAFVLNPLGRNKISILAEALNFNSKTMCRVTPSNNVFTKVSPEKFMLSNSKTSRTIKIKIPRFEVFNLINEEASELLTLSIVCANGASDEIDITITPEVESELLPIFRKYRYIRKN